MGSSLSSTNRGKDLIISVSGVRGTIPNGLDLNNLLEFTLAFAKVIGGDSVVIGRDSRPSGQFIEYYINGILLSLGKKIINIGIVPTPTLKAVVNATKSAGGIMISASHNPIEYNAFKLVGKNGFFFDEVQIGEFLKIVNEKDFLKPQFNPKSTIFNSHSDYTQIHIDSVLKLVDVAKIKKKKFKVFVDAVNGGGSYLVPELLKQLGCTVIKKFCEPDGTFPRPPEPTPKALTKTSKWMKESGADIGFALDPDADRLIVLTPKRGTISEEYTLPLSLKSKLITKTNKKNVVINLSTSFIIDEVANLFKKQILRSKVGEANVVKTMIESKSFFGGEGNGGVIDPDVISYGRDSLSGIALILNLLVNEGKSIDQIMDTMPELYMEKTSFPIIGKDLNTINQKILDHYSKFEISTIDGIRIDKKESWFHVRPSNTEPIIRVIGEAKTKKDLDGLLNEVKAVIG